LLAVPSAADIQDCLLKAITNPDTAGYKRKPKFAVFLESKTCGDDVVKAVGEYAEKEWGFKCAAMEKIKEVLAKLKVERGKELVKESQDIAAKTLPASVPIPSRGCSSCKTPVKKALNCGACKSIIYCSSECQVSFLITANNYRKRIGQNTRNFARTSSSSWIEVKRSSMTISPLCSTTRKRSKSWLTITKSKSSRITAFTISGFIEDFVNALLRCLMVYLDYPDCF
jgi:hypothetical protein